MNHRVKIIGKWLLAALVGLVMTGCASRGLLPYSHRAADHLIDHLEMHGDRSHKFLEDDKPLIITSFVEQGDLNKSSRFGRLIAEQIGTRLNTEGFKTVDVRLREKVLMQERNGEFALSRSIRSISKKHDAQAIIAGTYVRIADHVYVTVKMLHPEDGYVFAAHDFSVPVRLLLPEAGRYRNWPKREGGSWWPGGIVGDE